MVIALAALFFAAGGSTLALAAKKKPPAPQARCAVGSVRAIAEITGQSGHGVANLPGAYTTDASFFGQRFSCTGGAIQAERLDKGDYYVRFVGNPAATAVVSGMGNPPVAANVQRQADGTFHVTLGTPTQPYDAEFVIVAF